MIHPMFLLSLFTQEEGAAPPAGADPAANGADAANGGAGGLFGSDPMACLIPGLAIMAIFYFILIRPERKKQKQRAIMLGGMRKGDKVMTSSGIHGTVAQVQDDVVTVQVADGVRLRFSRAAIQQILESEKPEKEE